MTLHSNGLTKLTEESGELIQAIGKYIACPNQPHWDGQGNTKDRLEDEIADVLAASEVLIILDGLNLDRITTRRREKVNVFMRWASEP